MYQKRSVNWPYIFFGWLNHSYSDYLCQRDNSMTLALSAHKEIGGNKQADRLAKEVIQDDPPTCSLFDSSDLPKLLCPLKPSALCILRTGVRLFVYRCPSYSYNGTWSSLGKWLYE